MKVGVVSSVIASVIFIYLLAPAVRLITFLLTHVFSSLSRAYLDRLFEQAALLSGPDSSFYLLFLTIAVSCGMLTGTSVTLIWLLTKRASEPAHTNGRRISRFWAYTALVGGNIALILLGIMALYSTMFQLRIVSSFDQHLAAISPYVSDQELKVYRSRWTQMTSERDYSAIYAELRRVAATNSIRLPENKVFSFSSY